MITHCVQLYMRKDRVDLFIGDCRCAKSAQLVFSFFVSLFHLLGTRYQDVLRKIEIYNEEVFMDIDERDITKIDCALDISYSFVLSPGI